MSKVFLPKDIFDKVKEGYQDQWNKSHNNLNQQRSRKDRRKAERAAKRGKQVKPKFQPAKPDPKRGKKAHSIVVDGKQDTIEDLSENETWAALKKLKENKRKAAASPPAKKSKKPKVDYENFQSAAEQEKMARDEQDAQYYAKMLGQKSLKLKKTEDDGLDDILGDLDFDHFTDASQSDSAGDVEQDSGSEADSEPFIENPWGKDDTLSEGDFDSDEPDSESDMDEEQTLQALQKAKAAPKAALKTSKKPQPPASESDSESDSETEPFIENPWGKDDTLSEGDFTDNTDLSEPEASPAAKGSSKSLPKAPKAESEPESEDGSDNDSEPFIENPWTDDSLSEGDFDSEDGDDDEPMTAEQTMALLAKKKGRPAPQPEPDSDASEEELDDNMDEDETWAALKALKAKKNKAGADAEPEPAAAAPKPKKKKEKENPFLPGGKYVPPSKRRLLEQEPQENEETTKLRRQLKGVLNKLTEANLGPIINEVESLFSSHPKHLVGSLLTKLIIEAVVSQGTLQDSFLVVNSALVTALYKTVGVNFGAQYVQDIVQEYLKHHSATERNKDSSNLLMLIMGAYSLHMVGAKLIYDLTDDLLKDVTETNVELMLLIVRTCGQQLRSDGPEMLKETVIKMQRQMGDVDSANMTVRNKILVESILNLKNNRLKNQNEQFYTLQTRVRKFLGGVKGQVSEPLQVTLSDVRNIEAKGKWWIVGAAYNSGGGIEHKQPDFDEEEVDNFITSEPNWLALARKQRLNTDVRRAIFIAIMGAEDFMDACIRVDKLRLKSKQEREITHVLLHCLANEQIYNPYYALVAGKQCSKHTMRKSFQFSLWDYLTLIQESDRSDIHKAMHYARFYASLVSQNCIGLDILKVVDFLSNTEAIRAFIEVFFVFLFKAVGKDAESKASKDILGTRSRDARGLAKILNMIKDEAVTQGIQYILPSLSRSDAFAACKRKEQERVQWCIETAAHLLDGRS